MHSVASRTGSGGCFRGRPHSSTSWTESSTQSSPAAPLPGCGPWHNGEVASSGVTSGIRAGVWPGLALRTRRSRVRGASVMSSRVLWCGLLLSSLLSIVFAAPARAADIYDAAVAHAGRAAGDAKRDVSDKPADVLRFAGIKPGMHVLDFLGYEGYYSELLSYIVGPS